VYGDYLTLVYWVVLYTAIMPSGSSANVDSQ
jgi:hypothetical protein